MIYLKKIKINVKKYITTSVFVKITFIFVFFIYFLLYNIGFGKNWCYILILTSVDSSCWLIARVESVKKLMLKVYFLVMKVLCYFFEYDIFLEKSNLENKKRKHKFEYL